MPLRKVSRIEKREALLVTVVRKVLFNEVFEQQTN